MRTLPTALLASFLLAGPLSASLLLLSPAEAAAPTCAGERATKVGTQGDDVITGTAGRDVIQGLGGNDRIRGLGGNDLLCGGAGDDTILGGGGHDRLVAGESARNPYDESYFNDILHGGWGNDTLVAGPVDGVGVRTEFSYAQAPRGITADLAAGTVRGMGLDRLVGRYRLAASHHDDVVIGGPRGDEVWGNGGSDRISGGPGNDWFHDDNPYVNHGRSDGSDRLSGGDGRDQLAGSRGFDRLVGGAGDDYLYDLGRSRDQLRGGKGDDLMTDQIGRGRSQVADGGAGQDSIDLHFLRGNEHARVRTDLMAGTTRIEGTDTRIVTRGLEEVDAYGIGVWLVRGTEGPNIVDTDGRIRAVMLGGNDVVYAASGRDYVDGGAGRDAAYLGQWTGSRNTCIDVEKDNC